MSLRQKKYLIDVNTKIDRFNSIAIYGCGNHTKLLLNYLNYNNKQKILGLVDKDSERIGKKLFNYSVLELKEVIGRVDAIIISSDVYQQVIYERILHLKERNIEIIKIYPQQYYIPTCAEIYFDKIPDKYKVIKLSEEQYDTWNEFVDESPQGCIFNKTWYLEAVEANFEIYVATDSNKDIIGGMILPQGVDEKCCMPIITQTLGILLKKFDNLSYVNYISKEQNVIQSLVNNIPPYRMFNINFNYNFNNWLPFMWKGYNQYCRYTYVIDLLDDIDKVFKNMKGEVRRSIRKSLKDGLKCSFDVSLEKFYYLNKETFKRQGIRIPYSLTFLKKFDEQLLKHNSRKIVAIVDENDTIYAANYIIYDSRCAYNLLSCKNFDFFNSRAQELSLWEAIKFSSTVSKKFDFEGSCLKGVEEFFRGFGGKREMYFNIWKTND